MKEQLLNIVLKMMATVELLIMSNKYICRNVFSSTGQRPEELMPWHCVRRVCVRACVYKQLLVNAIKS